MCQVNMMFIWMWMPSFLRLGIHIQTISNQHKSTHTLYFVSKSGRIFMKINQNDRKRKFFGQISFEYEHNANSELTEKDFRESVIQRIKDYCKNEEDRYHIIFHDKDLKDDGSSKPLHAHFYIDFKHAHTYTSVFKALSISREQNLEFVRSSIKACRYLTHRNERNRKNTNFPMKSQKSFHQIMQAILMISWEKLKIIAKKRLIMV